MEMIADVTDRAGDTCYDYPANYIFESPYPFVGGWCRSSIDGVEVMKIRRKCVGDGKVREVLDVPYYPQLDDSVNCVPCSLKMNIEYFRNNFENGRHGRFIPELLLDEIAEVVKCRPEDGSPFKVEYGRELSKRLHPLAVIYSEKVIALNDLDQRIRNDLPTVVLYDAIRAYHPQWIEFGMGHASVVIGMDNDAIVLHDPNENAYRAIPRQNFEAAWEMENRRSILMEVGKLQTVLDQEDWKAKSTMEVTENGS